MDGGGAGEMGKLLKVPGVVDCVLAVGGFSRSEGSRKMIKVTDTQPDAKGPRFSAISSEPSQVFLFPTDSTAKMRWL